MGVEVRVSSEAVDIEISGWDRVLGFRTRIEIPLARVRAARVVPDGEAKSDLWIRTGGTAVPGLAAVGFFRGRHHKRQWWRVYRSDQVLVIDLDPASAFDRVVLEVDGPDAIAARINHKRRLLR